MPLTTVSEDEFIHVTYGLQLLLLPVFTVVILWIMSKEDQVFFTLSYFFETRSLTKPASFSVFQFYSVILHKANARCDIFFEIQFLMSSEPTTEFVSAI